MMLSPTEHAQVLVDNDYIMASLGVLSKRYPEAAVRLLEQSLGVDFTQLNDPPAVTVYQSVLAEEENRRREKEAAYQAHIAECEAMGYDMSAYKQTERHQPMGDCSHECARCTRPHCPNRKTNSGSSERYQGGYHVP